MSAAPGDENADIIDAVEPEIEGKEGFRSEPYQDAGGVWTIGYGATRDAGGHPVTAKTNPVSQGMGRWLLMKDLLDAITEIEGVVKISLTIQEMEALVDFVYNAGITAFRASTMLRLLNSGNYAGAAEQFPRWVHDDHGDVLAGLVNRRAAEEALFKKGMTDTEAPK